MRVLLTNDDGYRSAGIMALHATFTNHGHEVWMMAPTENMSACSHSITTTRPLCVSMVQEPRGFACNGTPVDCVILALRGALEVEFDCVVSGINIGPNLGDDITFSGTVAAARQSVLMGTPAIAISLFDEISNAPQFFESVAAQIGKRLPQLVALSDTDHLVNINFPNNDRQMRWVATTRKHDCTMIYSHPTLHPTLMIVSSLHSQSLRIRPHSPVAI